MPDILFDVGTYIKKVNFSNQDLKNILIGSLGIGFIISFTMWGSGNSVDVYIGLKNLFISFLLSLFTLFTFSFFSKLISLRRGYECKINLSKPLLLCSIFISFHER